MTETPIRHSGSAGEERPGRPDLGYDAFFRDLTGQQPFPYQIRLGAEPWPQLLDVPTGLGKTAAVVGAWLYKTLLGDPETGRRLVYCLPTRVLVEQTAGVGRDYCLNAAPHFTARGVPGPTVHLLMGGDLDEEWQNHPERPAIIVGTQDMLLSRALNRGYALSRYRWPIHFALLQNDCVWVLDEIQLMGVGVETSAQLQGLRSRLGTFRSSKTVWMSATLADRQLDTVDHRRPQAGWRRVAVGKQDLARETVLLRVEASKPVQRARALRLSRDSAKAGYAEGVAQILLNEHALRGGLTLAVLNRVSRAQAVYQALLRIGTAPARLALVHSRFRAIDRAREEAVLRDSTNDRIVVATQAVEAGVDISARTLVTELAPWPSLVQRFGRCNRFGGEPAAIFWLDIDTSEERSGLVPPYMAGDLDAARKILAGLEEAGGNASPKVLREIEYQPPKIVRPVIRRRDLLDLFDTTADLSGYDIDVSRYVRDGEDTDVQFYWRTFLEAPPDEMLRQPAADELCRVSVSAARDFLGGLNKRRQKLASAGEKDRQRSAQLRAWRWDPLERRWEATTRVHPGQVLLLHSTAGGYDPRFGWTGEIGPKVVVPPTPTGSEIPAGSDCFGGDPDCEGGRWVLLSDHLWHVRQEVSGLASAAGLEEFREALETVGLWHDVGKAHEAFQRRLLAPLESRPELRPLGEGPWAKSNHHLKVLDQRKHFRHELASALAWLSAGDHREDFRFRDLIAYLVAAHHGKVRMSLRSLPGETEPEEADRLFARGVWDGDVLPPLKLPNGRRLGAIELDLSVMRLGEGSWLERALHLRDAADLGPFRLALLETIVRVADWRASRKEQEGAYDA